MQTEYSPSIGQTSIGNATCDKSDDTTLSQSMSSAVGSLVSIFPAWETEAESTETKMEADFGLRLSGSFAKYDHSSLSWKTSQHCLFGGLIEFSETWPRAGMILHGDAFRLLCSGHHTGETGYLPSPLIGTPTAAMAVRSKRFQTKTPAPAEMALALGGKLNPEWVEWLMGFPIGHTDCEDLETQSCHKSQSGSEDE